jgi:hypothetical protein
MRLRYRSTGSPPRRTAHGQGLVEFALVLPVMILILLVAIDFGRLLFTYIQVHNAAREAASVASQNLDYPSLYDRAAQEANVQGQGGEGTLAVSGPICTTAGVPAVTVACPPKADASFVSGAGHLATVAVSKEFTFLTPLIGVFFPPDGVLDVSASATAPVMLETVPQGGGGGTPSDPCAVVADFTFSQTAWNKEVDVDANASTPTSSSCSDQIASYAWTWEDTSPPSLPPDKITSSATAKSAGLSGKDAQTFHVTLRVTTKNGATNTFQQDVLTVSK